MFSRTIETLLLQKGCLYMLLQLHIILKLRFGFIQTQLKAYFCQQFLFHLPG